MLQASLVFVCMYNDLCAILAKSQHSLFSKCDLCIKYAQERMMPGKSKTPQFELEYSSWLST